MIFAVLGFGFHCLANIPGKRVINADKIAISGGRCNPRILESSETLFAV